MTTWLNVKNNAESTLASGITAVATSLTVASGEGARFPSSNFNITIDDEILLCTTRSGDVLTVTRAQEGTSAAAHNAAAAVNLNVTAGIIAELQNNIDSHAVAVSSVHSFNKSCGVVSNAANILAISGNYYNLAFASEEWDTDNIHDNSTNNCRLTCKTAGLYIITGWVKFDPNATGRRFVSIMLNGIVGITGANFMACTDSGAYTQVPLSALYNLVVNDYVELSAMQASGGSLAIASGSTKFQMARIA